MKTVYLSLSLLVLNISAASEWNPTGATGWMTTNRHEADGVKFVLKTENSLTPKQADLCTDALSGGLTRVLRKDMSACAATEAIKQLIEAFEDKVYKIKETKFLNEMSKINDQVSSSSSAPLPAVYAINKMLLDVTLGEQLKLKLFGEAVPGECCTFFPPYTIEVEVGQQQESDSEQPFVQVDYGADYMG